MEPEQPQSKGAEDGGGDGAGAAHEDVPAYIIPDDALLRPMKRGSWDEGQELGEGGRLHPNPIQAAAQSTARSATVRAGVGEVVGGGASTGSGDKVGRGSARGREGLGFGSHWARPMTAELSADNGCPHVQRP